VHIDWNKLFNTEDNEIAVSRYVGKALLYLAL